MYLAKFDFGVYFGLCKERTDVNSLNLKLKSDFNLRAVGYTHKLQTFLKVSDENTEGILSGED